MQAFGLEVFSGGTDEGGEWAIFGGVADEPSGFIED